SRCQREPHRSPGPVRAAAIHILRSVLAYYSTGVCSGTSLVLTTQTYGLERIPIILKRELIPSASLTARCTAAGGALKDDLVEMPANISANRLQSPGWRCRVRAA